MKFSGHYRRRYLRRLTTIALSAAIGGPFAAVPAFAADSPPAPDVLIAPATEIAQGANVLYTQDFAGTSTQAGDWISGGSACLTAASGKVTGGIPACDWKSPDKQGSGALRLTGNSKNETGFALYQHPLTSGKGANIQFDMYQYKALKKVGADGISFFLVDGTVSPTKPGQYGGSLGYAGTSASKPGLLGGVIGVGFDEYGNFSVAGDMHAGGSKTPVPDSVLARGAEVTQYAYLDGRKSPVTFWFDTKTNRADAKVHVEIEISPANAMTVYLGGKEVLGPLDLGSLKLGSVKQPPLPSTFKFGFAASTGAAAAIHEISGLTITTLRPSLVTTVNDSGTFTQGGSGTITVGVANAKTAGPTDQPVTVTVPLPAGLTATAAAGTGWSCVIGTAQVTCTRSDALAPGVSYPQVTITTAVDKSAAAAIPVTVTAGTPDQQVPSDNVNTHQIQVAVVPAPAPQVTTTITPVGTFTSPGTGTYQANVAVSAAGGPTTGTTTEVFNVPAGQTVTGAAGSGWNCTVKGQQVTCTTAATVQPGGSFPPVSIAVSIPAEAVGNVSPTATATTAGQDTPSSAPAVSIPVTQAGTPPPATTPPHVTTTITPVGTFTSPGTGTYQATVTADPSGGPVTGPTTEVFNVPAGQTVTSATGSGWTCSVSGSAASGQQVSCTTPATAQPGASLPPVTIVTSIPAGATGTASPTATATTAGQTTPSSSAPVSIPVAEATPPPLVTTQITPVGAFTSPGQGTYQATVSVDPGSGPLTGTTTEVFSVPTGETVLSATGPGWTCATLAQQVTCTTAAQAAPGSSLPPVAIVVSIPAKAAATASPTATATTQGQASPSTAPPVTIPVTPSQTGVPPVGPDLSVTLVPQHPLVGGEQGVIQLGVANAASAAPTAGVVTATYSVPSGSEVTNAGGAGWTCAVQRWMVTCTRPGTGSDALAPGSSYPPVNLTTSLCHKATCTLAALVANVKSPGDIQPSGNTLTEDLAIQRESSVQVAMTSTPGSAQAVTYTVTVSNAGPTDSAGTQVAMKVPAGFTGLWSCKSTFGSGCAEPIGSGSVTATLYVAAGGTVTLTAAGTAPTASGGSASVSLSPGYTDTQCGQTCTATVPAMQPQRVALAMATDLAGL
jgi:uncharacterized repeat protein (TIGR01451 family)